MEAVQAIRVEGNGMGDYEIEWTAAFASTPVDVRVGRSPTAIEAEPSLRGAVGRVRLSGLEPDVRHYFYLQPLVGRGVVAAQRDVPLDGGVNFRDLGGYACADGRRVRWGRLYRSGHMSNLSEADKARFKNLGINLVCDLRLSEERARENAVLPEETRVEILEIPPGVRDPEYLHRAFRDARDAEDIVSAIHEIILAMVGESADRYRRLFEVLLDPIDRNILVNCSAGKERTGIGSALILTALGVPRETIYYDFMLSRTYFPVTSEIPRVLAKYRVPGDIMQARQLVMPLLETRESYLRVAFDFLDENYGGGLPFLCDRFGIGPPELAQLRDRYTA